MAKTLDEFEIPLSIVKSCNPGPLKRNSVITVVCACGAEAELQISSIIRTIKRVGYYRCLSCGIKAKCQDVSYKEKIRSGVVNSWSTERRLLQSEVSKKLWSDGEFRSRQVEASKRVWSDPIKRKEVSEKVTSLYTTEEHREKCKLACSNPEEKQARSSRAQNLWQRTEYIDRQKIVKESPEYIELQRKLALERFNNPEYRQRISDSLSRFWDSPSLREEMSNRVKALWNDPVYRDRQAAAASNPVLSSLKSENAKRQWRCSFVRQAIIDGIKRAWENPEYRAHASLISKQQWQNDEFRKKQAAARADMLSNGRDSILERTVQTLLDSIGIPYVRHHVLGYFEFDLFIPSHNILIECNGEYWHSLRKSRDAAKFNYVDTYFPGYQVLYLWERDFLNPNLIRHKLICTLFGSQKNSSETQVNFSFDDLVIKKMDTSIVAEKSYYSYAEEFFQSFHYAGFGRSAKVVYGLYFGETLIGACKFCSPIRNESATSMGLTLKQVLELDRFCLHPNYQKKNLASWFMSRCIKLVFSCFPDVVSLISFSDSTFGHVGTIYKASGWKQVHVVPPDYHYVSPDGFVVHKKTLYDHALRNGSKEADYALEFGYVKAWGKSKTKFRFDRPIRKEL